MESFVILNRSIRIFVVIQQKREKSWTFCRGRDLLERERKWRILFIHLYRLQFYGRLKQLQRFVLSLSLWMNGWPNSDSRVSTNESQLRMKGNTQNKRGSTHLFANVWSGKTVAGTFPFCEEGNLEVFSKLIFKRLIRLINFQSWFPSFLFCVFRVRWIIWGLI